MSSAERYEPVIGLEIHVQLNTDSKMFCRCENRFGDEPNTRTCPVCLGHPGALPTINAGAVEKAIQIGLALDCGVADRSQFHRKNYFYPDSPKAYQISQYDQPICVHGHLEVDGERIGITRAHLEEDAAKLVHAGGAGGRIAGAESSVVDFNRCGTPLVEIVTEPDIRSPEQALAFLGLLKNTLQTIGVSDCDMEKGSLRCDANVSVRPRGETVARHEDRAQEHELVQVPGRGDGGRDRAPDRPCSRRASPCSRRRCTTTRPGASCTPAGRRRRPTTTGTSRSPTSCRSSRPPPTWSASERPCPSSPGRGSPGSATSSASRRTMRST